MNQQLWNQLFAWITGTKCFIPEGCSAPALGIVFYLGVVLLVAAAIYLERERLVGILWKK
ncbi:MAG: hypothetical protein ABEJ99_06140 [Candidatus Nanohaloarchaea archaeon]